ncbi:MAG: glycosyltransferase [Deltaproteobacteria bacterium]|nr:glycosyltransferase [Deltaproteobacteria bacterium]MBW2019687.1 glycosyltransferase [Deltaproteobacteria bacterium]MBW2074467.1 glycosyltransferase [Deltaproteobacteria bacterium]RLB81685.1 MAG: glycosyltransferase family 2 protein [Deltaproteobacteria bacterium]
MPTVSVIIPTYNRAWALKEAIGSALAQDFRDFEIIVVDDGSTDDTPKVLESCQPICLVRQSHQGVSAARNAGIERASGRLITFLDSDDLWLPGKLSAQVAFFNTHPDALICQTEEIWIRKGIRVNPKKRHKKYSGMIFEHGLELCIVSPSAVMMRRRLLDEVGGFDEMLPVCEDYDLWLRVACRFPIYLLEAPLVIKRGGHPDQLSRRSGMDRFRIHALKKILESGLLTSSQYRAAVRVLKKKCEIYAKGCLKRGRVKEANHYMQLSHRFTSQAECLLQSKALLPEFPEYHKASVQTK